MIDQLQGNGTPEPGIILFRRVRAAFILQGSSLYTWCKANKVDSTNARLALTGGWNGPKGKSTRAKIVKAAGLLESQS